MLAGLWELVPRVAAVSTAFCPLPDGLRTGRPRPALVYDTCHLAGGPWAGLRGAAAAMGPYEHRVAVVGSRATGGCTLIHGLRMRGGHQQVASLAWQEPGPRPSCSWRGRCHPSVSCSPSHLRTVTQSKSGLPGHALPTASASSTLLCLDGALPWSGPGDSARGAGAPGRKESRDRAWPGPGCAERRSHQQGEGHRPHPGQPRPAGSTRLQLGCPAVPGEPRSLQAERWGWAWGHC